MAINTDILGMVWVYEDSYVVGREKVREFARAVKADDPASLDEAAAAELGYDDLVAPLTFVTILGKMVQADFMRKVDTGYETLQMVQVDQRFVFHKPILAGDELHARMEVESVVERFGADIVVTRNTLTNQARRTRDGVLHHDDGSRGRQLDQSQMGQGDRSGRQDGVIST